MFSHEITAVVGKHKSKKRIGRGRGSGQGKTAGRGHNGQHSRAGSNKVTVSEGGQMPLFRRLPKRGFNNANFATVYEIVNVSQLELFEDGAEVGITEMVAAGLVGSNKSRVKILGNGELTKKLNVVAHKFSKSATEKLTSCGGTAKASDAA